MRATDPARGAAAGLAACAFTIVAAGCQQTVVFEQPSDGGDAAGGVPGPSCSSSQMQVALRVTPESPEIILALDRSTAMNATLGSTTQIAAAQDALAAAVTKYQRPIANFDYLEFPGPDFCSQSSGCCASQVAPVNPNTFEVAVLHRCDTQGMGCPPISPERPTGAALSSSLEYYSQFGGPRRYVVLVTDGAPTCSGGNGGGGCQEAVTVNSLRKPGVETAVVVIGNPPDDQCLSLIANTGGRGGMNPPFYFSANTPDGLTATLDTVVRSMAVDACHLDLPNGSPDNPDQVTLLLGADIIRGAPDGWQYDDNSHTRITLSAAACQTFLDNPGSLGVLGCVSSRPH